MPRREAKEKEANMTWFLYKTKIMNAQFILSLSITFWKGFYETCLQLQGEFYYYYYYLFQTSLT